MSTPLTKNEFKSTEINGVLSVKDYNGTTGKIQCDIIEPKTNSITINGPTYISYIVWTCLANNYYDQFADGFGQYIDQFA
jgi:hypothetical protein